MVGSPTSVGDVLSLIGNSPVLHANVSAIENLRHAKSTFPMFGGGDLSPMMMTMMTNPQALLSNVMGLVTGQLNGMLGSMSGQLNSLIGGGGLGAGLLSSIGGANPVNMLGALTGVGGLSSALGALSNITGGLASPMGLLSLQAAVGVASALPTAVSLAAITNPVLLGPTIAQGVVDGLVAAVQSGSIPAVQAYTSQMQELVVEHQAAMAAANNASLAVSGVGTLAYALSSEGPFGDTVDAMLSPDARDTIMAHLEAVSDMIATAKARETGAVADNVGAVI